MTHKNDDDDDDQKSEKFQKKRVSEIAAEDLLVKALQATSVTSSFRKRSGVNLVVEPVIMLHLSPVTQNDVLGCTYFSTASKADLTGSKVERQVDLLLRARGASLSQTKHDWKNILVVGELKGTRSQQKLRELRERRENRTSGTNSVKTLRIPNHFSHLYCFSRLCHHFHIFQMSRSSSSNVMPVNMSNEDPLIISLEGERAKYDHDNHEPTKRRFYLIEAATNHDTPHKSRGP
ncbi:hypothetical protein CIRG_09904 [Coccidioides immitis RMSCC 2394]|uniref:Uncharacterized protein n=1 Tax=Coccidioides immitis RMSCC 2394 TaxID=404692 RepID=A0A0J6YTB0_COCIT|nr:hypothetical protein CIRG_09904 [Coccidioides immitis RMSCC 2394]